MKFSDYLILFSALLAVASAGATRIPSSSARHNHSVTLILHSRASKPTYPSCNDDCGQSVSSRMNPSIKSYLTSACSSYLSTNVASTVVTITSTTTVTIFNNNQGHNPTLPKPQNTKPTTRTRGLTTIAPTQIPDGIFDLPSCSDRSNGEQKYAAQFSSICSCQGITPVTKTVATLTTTVIEQLPTTLSVFKLKALFHNGTSAYLIPQTVPLKPWPFLTAGNDSMALAFDKAANGSALFGLTHEKHLMFESTGLRAWNLRNRIWFIQESEGIQVPGVTTPTFFVDMEDRSGEWQYSLDSDEVIETEFLWHARYTSANLLKQKRSEIKGIRVEPVF